MKLTEQAIAEFQALHRKHFGVELTVVEAEKEALALIQLVASTQPLTYPNHQVVDNAPGDEPDGIAVE